MKLLILTQYFPPEVGAPQNRLFELALRLKKMNIDVSIFTAMPNYPKMEIHTLYKGKAFYSEIMDGIEVQRSAIFVSKSKSIIPRLFNYFSFVFSSLIIGIFKVKKQDYILCESPPLFLGISAYLLCKFKGAKLIFNVSDLWPESAEKLGLVTNKHLLRTAQILEEFLYKKSTLITGQTQGIVANISSRFPNKRVYWLPNGVDINFYQPEKITSDWRSKNNFNSDDLILLYAGIIGHAQGLEIILNAAKNTESRKNIHYVLLGDGPEKPKLLELKKKLNLDNVHFFDSISKAEMPNMIMSIDAAIIPLKKLDIFLGAIPSKIFETVAMMKPILLGVDGEARELFINNGNAGWYFEPENVDSLTDLILMINNDKGILKIKGEKGRRYVSENFNREIIAEKFYNVLSELN